MNDYIIATASTADLDRSYLDEHSIPFIPYTFMIDGKIEKDDCKSETKRRIFAAMRAGQMPSTSQIVEEDYYNYFKSLMETGKNVLILDMSQALSNSYNNSILAAERVQNEFPDKTLYVADTRCVTGGLGLLVHKAVEKMESGASFDECVKYVEDIKMNVIHHFMVDDLKWLSKGGRLSNASAVIGTLFNIKPIMFVDKNGALVATSKVRGKKNALLNIVKKMKEDIGDPTGKEVFICEADCHDDAQFAANKMRELYPELGEITIMPEGPTVGSHVGPGFISIHYLGTERLF